jgi:hypothetical protein
LRETSSRWSRTRVANRSIKAVPCVEG